jgi:hypothetical protein
VLAVSETRAENAKPAEPPPDEERGFAIGSKPAWYLSGGATTGGTIVTQDRGWFVGGEMSLVRLNEGKFIGLYGDAYYDFGIERTYATSGVELGYKFLGIDGGAAARIGGSRVEWAPTGRLFLTFGIVSLYGRYAYFVDPLRVGNDHVVQLGGLLKIPFAAWGGK